MKRHLIKQLLSLIPLAAAACLATQANAQMLIFEFSGTLTQVVPDSNGFDDGWGSVGDPFSGTLSFDPTWQNSNNNDGLGTYEFDAWRDPSEQAITMSLSTPSNTRQIGYSDINASFLAVGFYQGNYFFSCYGEYAHDFWLEFNLTDPTGVEISGNSLPSNLNLNDWSSHYVDISGLPGGGIVRGDIRSLQIVPEPSAEIMVGLVIIIWSLTRRTILPCATR